FFFFSSRRRHTRSKRDWSSDVCSSDLTARGLAGSALYVVADGFLKGALFLGVGILIRRARRGDELRLRGRGRVAPVAGAVFLLRSEERRVGKEGRSGWAASHEKKKEQI